MNNKKRWSIVAAVAIAVAIGGGAYAFTASNTVPATTAGAIVNVNESMFAGVVAFNE